MLPWMFVRWQGETCERSHVTPRPSPRLSICALAGFCLHSSICAQTERQDAGWAPLGVWFCLSVILGSSPVRELWNILSPEWQGPPTSLPCSPSLAGAETPTIGPHPSSLATPGQQWLWLYLEQHLAESAVLELALLTRIYCHHLLPLWRPLSRCD